MLSTYKKWLKRELVKKGYWTAGVQAVGRREFEIFFRVFTEKTYKEYNYSIRRFFQGKADWVGVSFTEPSWACSCSFRPYPRPMAASVKIYTNILAESDK